MPLRQSVCRPYLLKAAGQELNYTFSNVSALAHLPKNAYFLLVLTNLPPSLIPSLLLLIQPLNFFFYKILVVLNNIMTVDSLILAQGRSPFHLSALEATCIKINPALCRSKNSCTAQRLRTNNALSLIFLQSITARLFAVNSRLLSCTLHYDGSS